MFSHYLVDLEAQHYFCYKIVSHQYKRDALFLCDFFFTHTFFNYVHLYRGVLGKNFMLKVYHYGKGYQSMEGYDCSN